MTDEAVTDDAVTDEPRLRLPTREAQVKQAFVAIVLVFFLGVAVGFALAKAF